jgi:inner membrane protein
MSPVTHFLTGWIAANASTRLEPRERAIIALASVAPDLDGIGIIPELLTATSDHPLLWYSSYHHVLCHNLAFGLVLVLIGWMMGVRRWLTGMLVTLSFHMHLAADLIGSRSPDGYQWPILYLYPFSHSWQLAWSGQWQLNAWPNYVVTVLALSVVLTLAWKRGYSPLEMLSANADRALVRALRRRTQ